MEERSDGILLRPVDSGSAELSWEETARGMAASGPRSIAVRGAEMAKTRPVVIVSLDALNERLQTVTIRPLTTQRHPARRSRVACKAGTPEAEIAVDQIRTNSEVRRGRKLGTLSDDEARALWRLITEMYGE